MLINIHPTPTTIDGYGSNGIVSLVTEFLIKQLTGSPLSHVRFDQSYRRVSTLRYIAVTLRESKSNSSTEMHRTVYERRFGINSILVEPEDDKVHWISYNISVEMTKLVHTH